MFTPSVQTISVANRSVCRGGKEASKGAAPVLTCRLCLSAVYEMQTGRLGNVNAAFRKRKWGVYQ